VECSSASGGLPVGCSATGLAMGGQVCREGSAWKVSLAACRSEACDGEGQAAGCAGRASVEDAQQGLLMALNEAGIAEYSLSHTLQGQGERLGPYLSQFVAGFIGSMSAEEQTVRDSLKVASVPAQLQPRLAKQMQQIAEPPKRKQPRKHYNARDEAIAEGLLAGALWEAQRTGWTAQLTGHLKLRALLTDLKVNENTVEYSRRTKLKTIEAAAEARGYSTASLGYGSTYFASVLQILRHKLIASHLQPEAPSNAVVFGSNLGWQCFFVSLMYGVRVDGFEIVQHRYEAAREFAQAHGVDNVHFHLEDATKAALEWPRVGLVYMTDLLWDVGTRNAIHRLIIDKAKLGTVVVSNRHLDKTKRDMGFKHERHVDAPVSWLDSQRFYLYQTG